MAKENKTTLPSSFGGLVRYYGTYKNKFSIKPDKIIFFSILLIVIVILLHATNPMGI